MSTRLLALVLSILLVGPTTALAQTSTARVTGTVLDAINGRPLPGVSVSVGTTVAVTDLEGRYVIDLPLGAHELRVSLTGFQTRSVTITVAQADLGRVRPSLDVTLPLEGYTEEVRVEGTSVDARAASLEAQLLERRRATTINDNLGGDQMKANADLSAASALQRVTGASVVDGTYVYVRGLGERYSNTSLNGAVLPTTEPERRVVPLDMFPASLLESVSIIKTYSADRSAEFAGGMVDIIPSRLPVGPQMNFSYNWGANSQARGESLIDHSAGDRDWLGLSNASRGLPGSIPATPTRLIRGGIFTPELGVSQAVLEQIGESLVNEWTPQSATGRPYQGFSASFGGRWDKLGISAGVNQSYRQDYQEEAQVYYRTDEARGLSEFSTYDYNVGSVHGGLSVLANVGYAMNTSNRLNVQVFTSNDGQRETRTFEGFNSDAGRNLRNSRQRWLEQSLQSYQVSGDHYLPALSNSRIDWRGSFGTTTRDEPDMREVLYEEIGSAFRLADESQSGMHLWNALAEDSWDVAVNWSTPFTAVNGLPAMIKVGPYVSQRTRDFSSRRFRFVPINVVRFDLTPAPEDLYTPANIGPVFELREETRATDFYDAEQTIYAGYGVLDLSLSSRARLIAGVRVEKFNQVVNTFDAFDLDLDGNVATITAEIDKTDVFPSINYVHDLGNQQNLRIAFSQTVNRPEFREVAPFEFTDIVGGRATVGNPDLDRTLIQNYDVRWEWFPGARQVVAASVFFKRFDQPIERFVEPTAQLRTSYQNAESARNVGLELEARREIVEHVTLAGNYTFVDSSITLSPSQTNVVTTLERPLAGTSRNIFNGAIELDYPTFSARLLLNYFGDRIADVGSLGLPDIYEQGRVTTDLIATIRFGRHVNLRLAGENLSNERVRFLQGGLDQRVFTMGRVFAVQFGYVGF
jgi:outer membrane receptor protein involved in Fe transport